MSGCRAERCGSAGWVTFYGLILACMIWAADNLSEKRHEKEAATLSRIERLVSQGCPPDPGLVDVERRLYEIEVLLAVEGATAKGLTPSIP